jgi:hypothetical protein
MRLTTAFNRILRLSGATVQSATFTDRGLVIGLRRRRRRLICPCGASTTARYDTSRRRWRHLDSRGWRSGWTRRASPGCCAAPGKAVDAIVTRVVADHIDDARLDHLYRIGVDEISYKRGRKFLTIVADHDTGNVVWVGKERSKAAFEDFFTALGPNRAAAIEAISLDGSSVYLPVTREQIPQARICLDPFHVIKWTNEVVESVYRAEAPTMPSGPGMPERREWRRARFAVRYLPLPRRSLLGSAHGNLSSRTRSLHHLAGLIRARRDQRRSRWRRLQRCWRGQTLSASGSAERGACNHSDGNPDPCPLRIRCLGAPSFASGTGQLRLFGNAQVIAARTKAPPYSGMTVDATTIDGAGETHSALGMSPMGTRKMRLRKVNTMTALAAIATRCRSCNALARRRRPAARTSTIIIHVDKPTSPRQ